MIYSNALSDTIENETPARAGYYWWVCVGDYIDSLKSGTVSFTPQIHTDGQTGTFFLNYILGHYSESDSTLTAIFVSSNDNPVSVDEPINVTVTNTNDGGEGSLRQSISDVNSFGEIHFDLDYPAKIELNSQLIIDKSLNIRGPENGGLTISGKDKSRVFHINDNLTVNISNGISDNKYGVGIRCYHSFLNLKNVNVSNCTSSGWGGGILFENGNMELSKVIIANNYSRLYGAGVHCYNGNLKINNSLFLNNNGEGLMIVDAMAFVRNITMIGGGIHFHGDELILVNSIIWDGPIYTYDGANDDSNLMNITYSNIQGGKESVLFSDWNRDSYILNWLYGNINTNPIFVDAANGDYRLQGSSPCIDAGIQNTMIFYNDGQDTIYIPPIDYIGSAPDMGFYEYVGPLVIDLETNSNPVTFSLNQNYPNPFNPSTTLEFTLPKSEIVELKVYNILGKEVATLVSNKLNQGNHTYQFDGKNQASGIYYYQLIAGDYKEVKKMILLR